MQNFNTQEYFARKDLEDEREDVGLGLYQLPEAPPQGGITGPVFRQSNVIVSTLSNRLNMFDRRNVDPSFDFLKHIPIGHAQYADRYINAQNQDDINATRWQIESELRDKALIANKPVQSFFMGFIANALDPSMLFPGSLAYKGIFAEYSALERAFSFGAAGATAATFSEIGLHQSQLTRTLEDSTFGILSSTILGAAIGSYAGKFFHSEAGRVAKQQTNDILRLGYIEPPGVKPAPEGFKPPPIGPEDITPPAGIVPYTGKGAKTVSAANVVDMAFPGQTLVMGERTAKLFGTTLAQLTPMNRLLTSPLYYGRLAGELLFENNYLFNKNVSQKLVKDNGDLVEQGYKESNVSLETWIKADLGWIDSQMMELDNLYFEQRGIARNQLAKIEQDKLFGKGLTLDEMMLEIYTNYSRDTQSGIREIDDSVKIIKNIIDKLYGMMIEVEELPPGLVKTTAKNHTPRYYKYDWIKQNYDDSLGRAQSWMDDTNQALAMDKPYLDTIMKDTAQAKRTLDRVEKLQTEYDELARSFQAREDLATKIFSAMVQKNQKKINKLVDEWANINTLTEQEILGLEEKLKESMYNLQVLNELEQGTRPIKESDLGKLKTIEKKISKAIVDRDDELQKLTDQMGELEEQFPTPEIKEKIKLLKQKFKYVKKIEDKKVNLLEQELEEFRSNFSPEKIIEASKIASLSEQIKASKKIGELKQKYTDKDISLKAKEFQKLIKSEGALLYRHRDRLAYLNDYLSKIDVEQAKKAVEDLKERLKEFNPAYFDSEGNLRKVFEDEDELFLAAENTLENILNLNDDRFSNQFLSQMGIGGKPKSLNPLVFLIPDERLGPMLERDFRKILPKYAKAIIPHYHITRMAQEMGFEEEGLEKGLLNSMLNEYRIAAKGLDQKAAKDLDAARRKAESDIIDGFKLLRGIYGAGSNMQSGRMGQMSKILAAYNYTRMMGYMTVSAITDPGAIILKQGYEGFVHAGLMPIIKQLESAKHNKDLLMSMGRSLNIFNGQRLRSFMDEEGTSDTTTGFEKFFNYLVTRTGNVTIMNQWTDLMQWIAGNASINRTIKYIVENVQTGKIPEKELIRLNSLGIPQDIYKNIYNEFKRLESMGLAGIDEGVYWMDFSKWNLNEDASIKAYRYFRAATLNDIDSNIVSAGLGDKPYFARTDLGRTILQFKNYGFGATNRILISGLQRRDAEFYQGAMMSLALGALGYVITSLLKNREMDLSAKNLAFEAIDRSGLLGIIMEVPLTLQKMGLLPGVGTSRYHSRSWAGALGGPTLGTLDDMVRILNKIKNADEEPLTTKDVQKISSMIPLNNTWYFDGINKNMGIVEGLAESLGAEEA